MIVRGRHPRLRQTAIGLAMLAPALILFITFEAYPAIDALSVSVHDWTGFSPRARYVGDSHYVKMIGRTAYRYLPAMAGLIGLTLAGLVAGSTMARRRNTPLERPGAILRTASGAALTFALLGFILLWTYGPGVADWLQKSDRIGPKVTEALQRWDWVGRDRVLRFGGDGDNYLGSCIRNNFEFMLIGGAFHLVYAFMFAAGLNLAGLRGRIFYRTMIFFPSFISAVGVAMLWKQVYSTKSGLLNFILVFFQINPVEWLNSSNMLYSIIACGVWSGVGSQMILLLAGMQRIPETYYEAARIDGAGESQVFRHVTIPLLREVILIVVTLWVIGSLKVFGLFQAFTIASEESNAVISVRQYELAFSNRDNIYMMGYATAMAVVLLVLVLVFAFGLRLLRSKEQLEY